MTYRVYDNGIYRDATTEEIEQIEKDSSGGVELLEDGWRLIQDITLTEDVQYIDIKKDSNGNIFNCKEFMIYAVPYANANNTEFSIRLNGSWSLQKIVGRANTTSIKRTIYIYVKINPGNILTVEFYQHNGTSLINRYLCDAQHDLTGLNIVESLTELYLSLNNTSDKTILTGSQFKIYGR